MRKYYLLFISIVTLLCSCSNRKVNPEGVEIINLKNPSFTDWVSLISLKEVVNFKENEDSIISLARKCLISDERILFWDSKMKRVCGYDRQGNYLYTIGKLGGAEYECSDLHDVIFVGENQERVELLDATGILVFNTIDGSFIEKKKLEIPDISNYWKFVQYDENSYLFFANRGEYSIYRWEANQMYGIRKQKGYQLISDYFYIDGSTCLVSPNYGTFMIDEYDSGQLKPKYFLDFGDAALPESSLPGNAAQFDKIDNSTEYFKTVVNVKESSDLLYIKVVGPSQTYYDIYKDKKTNRLWAGPADIRLGLVVVALEGESLYGLVYPQYLSKESLFYDTMKKYLDGNSEEDANPILIKFTLNEK